MLLLAGAAIADMVMLVGLGGLLYTSTNSLGWALAAPQRRSYVYPMATGVVGGLVSVVLLILF